MRVVNQRVSALERIGDGDELLAAVAEGTPIRSIAAAFGIAPARIYEWVRSTPEREEAFAAARQASAEAHVAKAEEALYEPGAVTSSAHATVAKARVEWHKWLASKRDPDTYGESNSPAVAIDLGSAFLAALKQYGHVPGALPAVPTIRAEIVS